MRVDCGKGHDWLLGPSALNTSNQWCPYCSGFKLWKKTILELCQEYAKSRNGKFLNKDNPKTKKESGLWQCHCGYEWKTKRIEQVLNHKTWCPKCAGLAPTTLEEMDKIAQSRGGRCEKVFFDYKIGKHKRGTFVCSEGHKWDANLINIKNANKWCGVCSSSIAERICREIFETLFEYSFPKSHPVFLKNPKTGRNLEIDGYCKELKIGFEYQGHFHYEESSKLTSEKWFDGQIQRDKFKLNKSQENGFKLIIIPEVKNKTDDVFINLILKLLDKEKLSYKKSNIKKININKAYSRTPRSDLIKLLKSNNHKLKYELWKGARHNYEIICNNGHTYKRTIDKLKSISPKTWCKYCSGNTEFDKRHTIDDVKEATKKLDITLLSKKYTLKRAPLNLKCSKGHLFKASFHTIEKNLKENTEICTYCKRKKLDIGHIKEIAKLAGGKCISKKYINAQTKMKFICKRNHHFELNTNFIVSRGRWCQQCYKIDKKHPVELLNLKKRK